MVFKFFDNKCTGSGVHFMPNQPLANELQKPVIKKVKRRKGYASFKDNIWGADIVDVQLISKYNKGIRFLLCVIDIFSNMLGLFLEKMKEESLLLMHFKTFQTTKYGLIKAVKFITVLLKDDLMTIT